MSFTGAAHAQPVPAVAAGGYLGAENQMIRVMVTSVDATTGVPTIVWGFDDASFLYRVQTAVPDVSGDTTLTLASAPVDSYHYPQWGQAVELLRDAVQLTDDPTTSRPRGLRLDRYPGDLLSRRSSSPASRRPTPTTCDHLHPAALPASVAGNGSPLAGQTVTLGDTGVA